MVGSKGSILGIDERLIAFGVGIGISINLSRECSDPGHVRDMKNNPQIIQADFPVLTF